MIHLHVCKEKSLSHPFMALDMKRGDGMLFLNKSSFVMSHKYGKIEK